MCLLHAPHLVARVAHPRVHHLPPRKAVEAVVQRELRGKEESGAGASRTSSSLRGGFPASAGRETVRYLGPVCGCG